jgi:hypothetical protein
MRIAALAILSALVCLTVTAAFGDTELKGEGISVCTTGQPVKGNKNESERKDNEKCTKTADQSKTEQSKHN